MDDNDIWDRTPCLLPRLVKERLDAWDREIARAADEGKDDLVDLWRERAVGEQSDAVILLAVARTRQMGLFPHLLGA